MELNVIHAAVKDRRITVEGHVSPTAGNRLHDVVEITLDSPWDDLEKRVTFYRGDSCDCRRHGRHEIEVTVEWDGMSQVVIPWEVLQDAGSFGITVVGSEDGEDRLVTYAMPKLEQVRVILNGEDEGIEPSEPTEDILHNVQRIANELEGSEANRQQEFEAAQATRSSDYINASSAMAHQFSTSMSEWGREFNTKASEADAAAKRADQAASDIREQAEHGEFDGADGVSPTANVQRVDGGAVITVTDKDGTTTAEVYDGHNAEGGGKVQDVQVAGATVLDENGVAKIPLASSNKAGVVSANSTNGVQVLSGGGLTINYATTEIIDARSSSRRPIVPSTLDYAVAAAMGDTKGAPWDETTKQNAQKRMGVDYLERRIRNLEDVTNGIVARTEVDASEAYAKDVPAGAATWASVDGVGGKTVVWSQLARNTRPSAYTSRGITVTQIGEGKFSVTGTSSDIVSIAFTYSSALQAHAIVGHKYLFLTISPDANVKTYRLINGSGSGVAGGAIVEATTDGVIDVGVRIDAGVTVDTTATGVIHDLTQIFGAGNEPTSITDPRIDMIKRIAEARPEYNPGELMSAEVVEVESMGRNLLDVGDFEQGSVDPIRGGDVTSSTRVRTGLIPIDLDSLEIANYTFSNSGNFSFAWRVYDENKNAISNSDGALSGFVTFKKFVEDFARGKGAKYLRIVVAAANTSAAISPSDVEGINIQLERGTTATTYKPYVGTVDTFDIPQSVRDLCPGYGWSAGTAFNGIDFSAKKYVLSVGSVDLGTLNYVYDANYQRMHNVGFASAYGVAYTQNQLNLSNLICGTLSNVAANSIFAKEADKCIAIGGTGTLNIRDTSYTNAAAFKAAMSGVMLYYELATPIEVDLSAVLPDDHSIQVEAGGQLVFKNTLGDDYRIAVPNQETFVVQAANAL